LVRQYLKKGSSFTDITDFDLDIIADQLNNRPRKSLGFATPNETFNLEFRVIRWACDKSYFNNTIWIKHRFKILKHF
jgi:hypothetical protein